MNEGPFFPVVKMTKSIKLTTYPHPMLLHSVHRHKGYFTLVKHVRYRQHVFYPPFGCKIQKTNILQLFAVRHRLDWAILNRIRLFSLPIQGGWTG